MLKKLRVVKKKLIRRALNLVRTGIKAGEFCPSKHYVILCKDG